MKTTFIASPNFTKDRQGYQPQAIVIHVMEGTLTGTDAWFRNPASKVSAHYGIGQSGEVHQYVKEKDSAWHAGRIHAPSWQLIKPGKGGKFINPNYYTIGIEHEGNAESDWSDAMYDASSSLIAEICMRWNIPVDRQHIVGHHEIYSLKSCPGVKVDLNKLVELSVQKAGIAPAPKKIVTTMRLNMRRAMASTSAPVAGVANKGSEFEYLSFTDEGEKINNVSRWYQVDDNIWLWGGGVKERNL